MRVWLITALLLIPEQHLAGQSQRPLAVDDLFEVEEFGSATISPDGSLLAYVVKRPRKLSHNFKLEYLWGNDRADVWVVTTDGGVSRNLTNGLHDGAGFWAPIWSPDGGRLAILSTRGGNVGLWLWDKVADRLERMHTPAVDIQFDADLPVWVSNRHLLVPILPAGQRPHRMTLQTQAVDHLLDRWSNAVDGSTTTASVHESPALRLPSGPQGQLLLVDVDDRSQRPVVDGYFRQLRVSPDGRFIAFLRAAEVVTPPASGALEPWHVIGEPYRYQVGIATSSGAVAALIEDVTDVFSGSLTWAPDGGRLIFIGYPAGASAAAAAVYQYDLETDSLVVLRTAGLALASPRNTGAAIPLRISRSGEVFVQVTWQSDAPESEQSRADWWRIDHVVSPLNVTAGLPSAPSEIIPDREQGSFVGVVGGDLVRFHPREGTALNLTEASGLPISSIVWPVRAGGHVDRIVVRVRADARMELHEIDLLTREHRLLTPEPPGAAIRAYHPPSRTVALTVTDGSGSRLLLANASSGSLTTVTRLNAFLEHVIAPTVQSIDYVSQDGQPLTARIILPAGYQPGRRYPLVAWIYPGSIFARRAPYESFLSSGEPMNPQLLAARGYAILLPSMPLAPEGAPSDPLVELSKGVLPAVDRAIELGYADSTRLGLMGHSYGGYGTYGLVTQTSRFSAAVASAGITNLTSHYGMLDPRVAHNEYAPERMLGTVTTESGQLRMGAAPWVDPGRYVRNSPIFFVHRVTTPVLLIHGALDYVPVQQAQEFFSGLYRQNARAVLVTYSGEGHILQSPANVRDMWHRVFNWFDHAFGLAAIDDSLDVPRW